MDFRQPFELLAQPLADDARVGLAAGLLHHLADEEAEQALLAAAVLLDLAGVRGDHRVDDRVELADVADGLLGQVRLGAEALVAGVRERLVEGGARDLGAGRDELRELGRRSRAPGRRPVATNAFASTFAVSFASAPASTTADQSRSRPPVTSTSAS